MLLIAFLGVLSTVLAETSDIRMPNVYPQGDAYYCTSVEMSGDTVYLTGFEALQKGNAHHILLFGCEEPGSDELVWDCGEMSKPADGLQRAPTCASKPDIVYAWALDAPALKLPEGVAFRVGGDTNIRHLVMQVHYMKTEEAEDTTGIKITHTDEEQPKTAATMLLVTGGLLPAKTTESFETACVIEEDVEIHPFAYRTHTHKHGTDVAGYLVQEDEKGDDHWTLLGRRNPQLPQMFVPIDNSSIVIRQGDMLSARCVLKNDEDRDIEMGATGNDEMCNFYLMYWAENDNVMLDNTCFSPGAPNYRWTSEAGLNNIPQ